MDTYLLKFSTQHVLDGEMNRFVEFVKQRSQLRQAFWLTQSLVIFPNSQRDLQEIVEHPRVVSMEKFVTGDTYRNSFNVVFDEPVEYEDEQEYIDGGLIDNIPIS